MGWINLVTVIMLAATLRRTPPWAAGIRCPANYCSKVTCQKISASECAGKVVPNATDCGCCESCVKQLEEGEICFSFEKFGIHKWAECKEGLQCNEAESRCEKKPRIPPMLYQN